MYHEESLVGRAQGYHDEGMCTEARLAEDQCTGFPLSAQSDAHVDV
jgi:hypothetical protein